MCGKNTLHASEGSHFTSKTGPCHYDSRHNFFFSIFVGPSKKDLSSGQVSGGERTKILSLFFHTLWKHLSCPFRALDEWDCNLDHKERRCVEEVLVETSKKMSFQTFFISPQDSVYANSDSPPELLKLIRLVKNWYWYSSRKECHFVTKIAVNFIITIQKIMQ